MFLELEPVFNNEGAQIPFDYSLGWAADEIGAGLSLDNPARVTGKVYNAAGVVHLSAKAEAVVLALCDRCAADVRLPMNVPVNHVLVTSLNDEDNDELILLESMRFDLDAMVREDFILALPSKILCRNDCRGLCGVCGANLNETQCGCAAPADPRLEALKQFLKQ